MSITVVTDSTACLTPAMIAESGVIVVPIHVIVDGRTHLDGVDINSGEVATALVRGASVSTAKPTPQQFLDAYTAAADGGATEILSVHVSAALSGTYDSARLAARDSPVPVTVIDTHSIAMGLGFAAMSAAAAATGGLAAAVDAAAAQAEQWLGGIDFAVNNAGFGMVGAIEEVSIAEVQALFDINLFAAIRVIQAVLPGARLSTRFIPASATMARTTPSARSLS